MRAKFVNVGSFSGDYCEHSIHKSIVSKVNSVQEACAKCFAVHLLKFEILQVT